MLPSSAIFRLQSLCLPIHGFTRYEWVFDLSVSISEASPLLLSLRSIHLNTPSPLQELFEFASHESLL